MINIKDEKEDFIVNSKFFWILFYDASNSYKSALNLLSRNRSNAEIFLPFWLFKDKQQKDATMHKCSSDLINSLTIVVSIFDRSHFLFQKVYLMWTHFYHLDTVKIRKFSLKKYITAHLPKNLYSDFYFKSNLDLFSSTIDLPLCMKWSFFWFNLLFFLACSNTYEPRLKFVKFSTWWCTCAVKVNQVTHTKRFGFLFASFAAVVIVLGLEAASANTFASIPQQRRFILIVLSLTIIFSCNKR